MRAVTRLFGLAAAGALFAGSLQAQTCVGYPSFDAGKHNITGFLNLPEDATQFGGNWNWGMANSLFLGVGASTTSYDVEGADNSTSFGAMVGKTKTTSGGWSWCPMAAADYGTGNDATNINILAGVGLGGEMGAAGMFTMAPYGTAGVQHMRFSYDNCPSNIDCDTSDTGLGFDIGLGLRMSNGLQVTPHIMFSTIEGTDSVIGVRVSWPFGGGMM